MEENNATALRELQLAEAEMLHDFKVICEKHGLCYYIDFGTLLGAVRHQGFIPWDDDVDVTMPYNDYVKFLRVAQEEFGNKYFLQTSETDKNYHFTFAKMRKNSTVLLDKYHIGWDIHHGVWLDIFPIVEVNNGLELTLKKATVSFCNYLLMDQFFALHIDEFTKKCGKVGCFIIKLFHRLPREKRIKIRNSMMRGVYRGKNKKYMAAAWTTLTKPVLPHIYNEGCKLMFENEEYNAPKNFKERLAISYGDYMQLPPEDQRIGHSKDTLIDLNHDYDYYIQKK